MKRATIIWRPIIAFMLLMVFFTIQSAKVLHSHAATITTHVSFDGDTVDQPGDCAVCDYQLSKDTDLNVLSFDIHKPEFFFTSLTTYKHSPITSIGLHFSDRGPPAMA